jgi:hypothetical protein
VNREEFLIDDTGNRRFWVAAVGRTREQDLIRDRDQLWAEAAYLEAECEPHNIPEELWSAAEKVAERHTAHDPITDAAAEELAKLPQKDVVITAADLFQALDITDVTRRRGPVGRLVASGARRAGWQSTREWLRGAGATRCYRSPQSTSREHLYIYSKQDGRWHKGDAVRL